jgi:hypothetical protein
MDFASSTVFSSDLNGVVDGIYVLVVVGTVSILNSMMGPALNGMASIGVDCSFSFNNFSNSASISLSCAFCCMISFSNYSFSFSTLDISLACDSSVGGNFNCFLKDAISALLFFNISSVVLHLRDHTQS